MNTILALGSIVLAADSLLPPPDDTAHGDWRADLAPYIMDDTALCIGVLAAVLVSILIWWKMDSMSRNFLANKDAGIWKVVRLPLAVGLAFFVLTTLGFLYFCMNTSDDFNKHATANFWPAKHVGLFLTGALITCLPAIAMKFARGQSDLAANN